MITLLLALWLPPVLADDWPQFRGPGGAGVCAEKSVPTEWGPEKNVRWKTALPGNGNGSPIVVQGRVYVTCAEDSGKKRHLVCLDRADGKILWTRTVEVGDVEPTQQDNPYAGSTPCADGEGVVVWHASGGLHAYDAEGKPRWKADFGRQTHMWGYGSSPILHGDRVVLNGGPGPNTFLASVDRKTGKVAWKVEEKGGDGKAWVGSWATPVVATLDGKERLVVAWPGAVKAHDPADGKAVWSCEGLGQLVYSDVALGNGFGVATGEDEAGDCVGFKLGGAKLWARPRPLEVGTGLIVDGRLWTIDNDGMIRCTEVESGKEVLKERSPVGPAWSSLILAGGRIYATGRNGDTLVFAPGTDKISGVVVNKLGEPSHATPAFSEGRIFLRTSKSLVCVATKS